MKQNMKRKIRSKLRHIAETYRNINELYITKIANCETKRKHNKKYKIKQKIKRKLRNITETYRNIWIFFIKAAAESGVWRRNPKWNPLFAWNCEPSAWIQERNFSLDFGWWVFQGKHENGRGMLEIVWTCFEQMGQLSYWTTKVVPWHVLMASFSCFPMMVQHSQVGEIWAPNSRAFHAVGGPFTQWEVLFTDFHGDSRCVLRPSHLWCWEQGSKHLLCFAVCSVFFENTHMFLYVSVLFRSLLLIFCWNFVFLVMFAFGFAVCSLSYVKFIYVPVCFCYVSQLAPYFPFHVLFYVMLSSIFRSLLSFLRNVYDSICMFLYASVMFCSLLFIFCFIFVFLLCSVLFRSVFLIFCFTFCFLLCFCYFHLFHIFLNFTFCFMLYSFHVSADFLLETELCNVLVVCFCYVSVLCVFLCSFLFLTKICYVCGRFLLCLICWFSVFFSMFPFCLQSRFCLIWIMLKSDMWSSMFLLGFCLYVLLQYQVFSSIGQSLEFANSVGFWVGKSGVSVPSLSRERFFPSCQHN